jgi:hypothetical protein
LLRRKTFAAPQKYFAARQMLLELKYFSFSAANA